MVTEVPSNVERSETDILDPQPIVMKVGRKNEYDIVINELVLRQYNKIFKVFSKILTKFFETNLSEINIDNFKTGNNWKGWLPGLIGEAGDDIRELLIIALDVEDGEIIDNITGKQLPDVLSKIIEINGLEQMIVGFRRLSVTIVTEMAKQKQKLGQ